MARKVLALAVMVFVGMSLFAVPASAVIDCIGYPDGEWVCPEPDGSNPNASPNPLTAERRPHATKCYTMHRGSSNQYRTLCWLNNTRDIALQEQVEGLMDFVAQPEYTDDVDVYVDWLRLINADNGNILKEINPDRWYEAHPTQEDSVSTAWYDVCNQPDGEVSVYTKARFKVRWEDIGGSPVGDFKTGQGGVSTEHCNG